MKKEKPVNKGQRVELEIESLAPGGKGVGKINGFPIFIDRVATKDKLIARVFDVRKSFAIASLEKLLQPSTNRTSPICEVFDRCGGCQWQHIEYNTQLKEKKDLVVQSIERIGGLSKSLVEDTIGASHHIRYRNKVQFPVKSKNNSLEVGYFERNSHVLVDIETCPVQPEELDNILIATKEVLKKYGIRAYDENTHTGLLRHLVARQSIALKEILLTLVVNLASIEDIDESLMNKLKKIAGEVKTTCPNLVGICLNFNNKKGNRILTNNTVCLVGSEVIEEVLVPTGANIEDGLKFRLSANSFFQVHTHQAVTLLEQISSLVDNISNSDKPTIIDAYAGVGTIALWLAKKARTVYAVESNPFAVADGRTNALLNEITNIEFHEGLSEDVLPDLSKNGIKADILILDPPRKGISKTVLEAVLCLSPKHIIYVSCNPSTLARDLKELKEANTRTSEGKNGHIGYKTKRITPIDMFPQTYHVESIAYLERDDTNGSVGNMEESS